MTPARTRSARLTLIAAFVVAAICTALSASPVFSQDRAGSSVKTWPLPPAYWRGLAAADAGDWAKALGEFRAALTAEPASPPILFAIANAHAEQGRNLLSAVHLRAYLQAWPQAPNAARVEERISRLIAPSREIATTLFDSALALSGLVPTADHGPVAYDLLFSGDVERLSPLLVAAPRGTSDGIATFMIDVLGAMRGQVQLGDLYLRDAIAAEATLLARDCPLGVLAPDSACPTPEDLTRADAAAIERGRQCWEARIKVATSGPAKFPQPAERARSYLSYAILARLRASGVNWEENGIASTMGRLTQDYYGFAREKGSPLACGYRTRADLTIITRTDGTLEAWLPSGPLPWSRPPDVPRPAQATNPFPRPLEAVTTGGFTGGLYARNSWAIPFSDPVFGDLGAQVSALANLPENEQVTVMWRLATRLAHVVRRTEGR